MSDMPATKNAPLPPSGTKEEITFADIVRFFGRNWRLIFGLAALAGLGTALVLLLLVPNTYEASATLYIVPPRVTADLKPRTLTIVPKKNEASTTLVILPQGFGSDLKPQPLTIQSCQKILESDAVIAEVKKRLVAQTQFPFDRPLRLGAELESRISAARRPEEVTAPMLQAVARGRTGEQAAALANTWAEVFLERTREVIAGTTLSTVKSVDEQYLLARDNLAKIEDARVLDANALQKQVNEAATRWGDRITTFKGETSSLTATFQAETRRLVEEFHGQHSLEDRKAQLAALRRAYGELQEEQVRVTSLLQLKHLQLDAARKQLAETPQLLTVHKAITDDALWRSLADSKSGNADWKAMQQRSLATQEINPVHTSLSTKVAELEMDANALAPRGAALTKDLERISAEMKTLEAQVRTDEANLEKLAREREAGLQELAEERGNKLSQLTRNREEELDATKRQMDTRLGQIDRNIDQQRDLFRQLAETYNQAILAKGEDNAEGVRLSAPAVVPEQPQPRRWLAKALLFAFLGGMLGLAAALVRQSWNS
jgi:uncharacterized protein involved in exopolysaccharide biosynthesis